MVNQIKLHVIPRICFHSSDLSWLSHRKGRMARYGDNISLCYEMIGAANFNKLDHLGQVKLQEICHRIRGKLAALSVEYSLKHTVPYSDNPDVGYLTKNSVTFAQYRAFMRSIFYYLIPFDLIGDRNMRSIINHISSILFRLGFGGRVGICELYSVPFKTSILKWSKRLSSHELCCISRKLLCWFLEFSIQLTRTAFYVTPENRTKQLRFYRKDVWKRIENHNFRSLFEKRSVKKVKDMEKSAIGVRVRLFPKNSVTRPLVIMTGKGFSKRLLSVATKIACAVIDRICLIQRRNTEELPLTGAAVWNGVGDFVKRFHKFIRTNNLSRIYAVKTDVRECFDSIDHDRLRSILKKIIISTKHYRLNANLIGECSLRFAQQYCFGCRNKEHENNVKEVCITGGTLLRFLETYTISKEFMFRNGIYQACRGIPQGNRASALLCNLYLGATDCARFSELMRRRDTLLIRYVDDYILLTTNLNFALKFLEVMHFGMDDHYNLIADSVKTVINFHCERDKLLGFGKIVGSNSAIPWCGLLIYPGLGKYSIDWARMHWRRAFLCRMIHKMNARDKRIAVLKFLKLSLLEKYRMIQRMPSSSWKVRVLRKFGALGRKLYGRPYARKVRLSRKGRWNQVFWRKMHAWIQQGFRYQYNTKLAHLYGCNSSSNKSVAF